MAFGKLCAAGSKPSVVARDCPTPKVARPISPPPSKTPRTDVEICMYPARLPVVDWVGALGFDPINHWFLRTKDFARGMQAKGAPLPLGKDVVKDQTWDLKAGTTCVDPATINPKWQHVDAACVAREFSLGKDLGRWVPFTNDCHVAVSEAIDKCALSTATYETKKLTSDLNDANAELNESISRLEEAVKRRR